MTSFAHDTRELAETYDRVSDAQFEDGKHIIKRLALTEDARVLDVGCGTGRLARFIAERVPRGSVVGIDPVAERVAVARSHGGATFEVGRAEDLGAFADASFDAVTMSSVFHWVEDKPKALAEARRVLRSGGRLGVTTFPHELVNDGTMARIMNPLLSRAPYVEHLDMSALTFAKQQITTTDYARMILASGLEPVELHVTQRIRHYASAADVYDFIESSAFGNFLRIVAEPLRAPLRADILAALNAQCTAEGVITRDWRLLFVAKRP
jgi:ubiquinone/menaquinone biosynthesis C-methylase UbiE